MGKLSVYCLHQYCVFMKGIGSGEALCVLSSSVLCAYEKGGVIEKLSKHIDYCLLHFCMFMKRRLVMGKLSVFLLHQHCVSEQSWW